MPEKTILEDIEEIDLFKYEKQEIENGHKIICGIDEAGRGPLAGPVFAAAVILPHGICIPGLDDSKKLTEKKREMLFDIITEKAASYGIYAVSEKVIDEINILNATYKAMRGAFDELSVKPDIALIDGNSIKGMPVECRCIVKGDAQSANIAAASILAKVSRDRYMVKMAKKYPGYLFEKHKGYPTRIHYAALRELGKCDIHRNSFLKKFYAAENKK